MTVIDLRLGDCRDILPTLADNSVDAVVCDPPYELTSKHGARIPQYGNGIGAQLEREQRGTGGGFMGMKWDATGISYNVAMWREVLRVMKPGAHLLAFGGTRTQHRMVCAIEDAGFEIRDSLAWLHGQGFPKSANISKQLDKAAGAEREVVGRYESFRPNKHADTKYNGNLHTNGNITAPATPDAARWGGWGTALKPAMELICMARKPLSEGTVAANVLRWGTGAINVDACRIGIRAENESGWSNTGSKASANRAMSGANYARDPKSEAGIGRWPANVLLDEEAGAMLDEQTGTLISNSGNMTHRNGVQGVTYSGKWGACETHGITDTGGASRFFYCAKASRSERNQGCEDMEERPLLWSSGTQNPGSFQAEGTHRAARNNHPCVKPVSLMRWLVRLVTPPGGIVLDPFLGSGTTGIAAALEGFGFVGIELDPGYFEIAQRRIEQAQQQAPLLAVLPATVGDWANVLLVGG